MTNLTANSTNNQIEEAINNVNNGYIHCYFVDFSKMTPKGLVPVYLVQGLDDVPKRGTSRSGGGINSFAANDILGDIMGIDTTYRALYRCIVLLDKRIAERFCGTENMHEQLGTEVPEGAEVFKSIMYKPIKDPKFKVKLIVVDSFKPSYEKQDCARYKKEEGEDKGKIKLSDGKPFYTEVLLVKADGPDTHSVFQIDVETEESVATSDEVETVSLF